MLRSNRRDRKEAPRLQKSVTSTIKRTTEGMLVRERRGEAEQGYLHRGPGKWGAGVGAHHVTNVPAPRAFLPPDSSTCFNIWGVSFLQGDFSGSRLRNPNTTRHTQQAWKTERQAPHEPHLAERARQGKCGGDGERPD